MPPEQWSLLTSRDTLDEFTNILWLLNDSPAVYFKLMLNFVEKSYNLNKFGNLNYPNLT